MGWPIASIIAQVILIDLVFSVDSIITAIGMAAKKALADAGVKHTAVMALTSEHIGYILTPEEYAKSGYEVTASRSRQPGSPLGQRSVGHHLVF